MKICTAHYHSVYFKCGLSGRFGYILQQGVSSIRISLCKGQIQGVVLTLPDGGKALLLSSDTACPGYQRQDREDMHLSHLWGFLGEKSKQQLWKTPTSKQFPLPVLHALS